MCKKPKEVSMGGLQAPAKSTMRTRSVAIFSSICCIISLTITFLCLFSGNKSSYMWDSPVVSINTTLLGHELLPNNLSYIAKFRARTIQTTLLSRNPETATAPLNESTSHEASTNSASDIQSAELGIQQWYNLNILYICEGSYYPAASIPGAKLKPGACTSTNPMGPFSLTTHLQKELQNRTLHTTLSDLGWPPELQGELNSANAYLDATLVLYIFSVIFLFATLTPSAILAFRTRTYEPISRKICLLSAITFILTLSSAITIEIFSRKTTIALNTFGNPIGVSAVQGQRFLVLTCTNVGVLAVVSLIWVAEAILKSRENFQEMMRLHQEHYERARIWGKIGALEGEEPKCSCADPWKVTRRSKERNGHIVRGNKGVETEIDFPTHDIEDTWIGVNEKVLVLDR